MNNNDQKIEQISQRVDLIATKALEHDEQLRIIRKNMTTKSELREIKDILESLVTIVKKIQEYHTFAIEWLKRLQDQVERQEEDLRKIKMHLNIS